MQHEGLALEQEAPPRLSAEKVAAIARVTHEANRAYCIGIGDLSQVPWDSAPDWQRESAIAGVRAKLDDPSMTPEQQHEGWCKHKLVDGWTYGPKKDAEKRTHPCLVPYAQLPPEQRAKDALFGAVVLALAGG